MNENINSKGIRQYLILRRQFEQKSERKKPNHLGSKKYLPITFHKYVMWFSLKAVIKEILSKPYWYLSYVNKFKEHKIMCHRM